MINQGIQDKLILHRREDLIREAENLRLANEVQGIQISLKSILSRFTNIRNRNAQVDSKEYQRSKVSTQTAYTV